MDSSAAAVFVGLDKTNNYASHVRQSSLRPVYKEQGGHGKESTFCMSVSAFASGAIRKVSAQLIMQHNPYLKDGGLLVRLKVDLFTVLHVILPLCTLLHRCTVDPAHGMAWLLRDQRNSRSRACSPCTCAIH